MKPDRRILGRDEELISGLRANDSASMAALYDAHAPFAFSLALRVLGRSTEAEDVVQESFMALWRQAERIDAAQGIRGYLLTIVHHKAVDRLRRGGRRREAALESAALLVSSGDDPEAAAERLADQARVREALSGLPDEQRETVVLAYFDGMTMNDVASRMGVPLGTVKSRLRLALGRLRRELRPDS